MAIIKKLNGIAPTFGEKCYIAENATIIGEVSCGDNCSFWFNVVLRGDVHYIKLGDNVNIQDCAVVHATYQTSPTTIGNNVSVGHSAIVHGCTIEDNVLIGMGSIVMDDVVVGTNSIIAAGSVVTKGTQVESGSIYAGIPAKKIGVVSENLKQVEIERIAQSYIRYASWYENSENI